MEEITGAESVPLVVAALGEVLFIVARVQRVIDILLDQQKCTSTTWSNRRNLNER